MKYNNNLTEFESFLKTRLNDLEVDSALAKKYWKEVKLPGAHSNGKKNFFKYLKFAFIPVILLLFFIRKSNDIVRSDKKDNINNGHKATDTANAIFSERVMKKDNHKPLSIKKIILQPDTITKAEIKPSVINNINDSPGNTDKVLTGKNIQKDTLIKKEDSIHLNRTVEKNRLI